MRSSCTLTPATLSSICVADSSTRSCDLPLGSPLIPLPPALAGLRIGFISDVHCSRWLSPEDVYRTAARLNDEHPDLIVLGGDYVTWGDRQYVQASAQALSSLSAPHGVFGILGNHDDD